MHFQEMQGKGSIQFYMLSWTNISRLVLLLYEAVAAAIISSTIFYLYIYSDIIYCLLLQANLSVPVFVLWLFFLLL